MSLRPRPIAPVPDETVRVARAAFPKGNPYLTLRDALGTLFHDDDFTALYPITGQPGLSPWRLALVTIVQCRETFSDRQAAEAVRGRIDWKYLLGLALTDPRFDFSVRSAFSDRLLAGSAEEALLNQRLQRCQGQGLLKSRGQQRTDSTHVLAAIRTLNRLELVGETLWAALNALAREAPEWLQRVAPLAWYERYAKRIEDARLVGALIAGGMIGLERSFRGRPAGLRTHTRTTESTNTVRLAAAVRQRELIRAFRIAPTGDERNTRGASWGQPRSNQCTQSQCVDVSGWPRPRCPSRPVLWATVPCLMLLLGRRARVTWSGRVPR